MNRLHKEATAAIEAYYRSMMPTRIVDLRAMASWDLYFGPNTAEDYSEEDPTRETVWPGYVTAVAELSDWSQSHIGEVWYDADSGEVLTSEPEGGEDEDGEWHEPFLEQTYYFDRGAAGRAVFGELARNGVDV